MKIMHLIVFYCIAWIGSIIVIIVRKRNHSKYELMLRYHLFFSVGCGLLFNFIGHVFLSKMVADSIGWVTNGFQIELGFVSFGLGICGILSLKCNYEFWLAVTIPVSTFLIGAAIIHIKEIVLTHNYQIGNVIPVLPDMLIPVTLLILLKLFHTKQI
jgi:hypothetical protein